MNTVLDSFANLNGYEYESEYPLGWLIPILNGWKPPIVAIVIYILGVRYYNGHRPYKVSKDSLNHGIVSAMALIHNALLFAFSFSCFLSLGSLLLDHLQDFSISKYCDRENKLWNNGLGYWAWLFYLSKYYEIFDTAIILVKGRASSFLQTYHHAGAILCLHLGFYTKSSTLAYFIVFNSFIHSIMYTYYALTTIGIKPLGKVILTTLQILQFVIGISIGVSVHLIDFFTGNCMKNNHDRFALLFNLCYLLPLTKFFVDFFKGNYSGDISRVKK